MKKIINHVDNLLDESLNGFAKAHQDIVSLQQQPAFVRRATISTEPKVAVISGGGSGHEPLHTGLVGKGMLDAACPGQIFTSPTPDQMLAAAESVENGAGVLFIVKNYAGDVMNFEIAAEMLECQHETVLVGDRVANNTASMGFALTSCTVPAAGRPTFELSENEIEMGVGIHGERGREPMTMSSAEELVQHVTAAIDKELNPQPGQHV